MSFPALPITWLLDGFEFNVGADASGHSAIVDVPGWDSPAPPKPRLSERVEGHGAYRGPNYSGSKVVNIIGHAQAESPGDREALFDRLSVLCIEPQLTYPLTCNNPFRNQPLSLFVERNDQPDIRRLRDGVSLTLDFQLVATDPWKYGPDNPSESTGLATAAEDGILWNGSPSASGGIEWNGSPTVSGGLIYQTESGSSGILRLSNAGNRPAPVRFVITASVTNPQLDCIQLQRRLKWLGTVNPGSSLTLDSKTQSAFLGDVNVGAGLSNAEWFDVPAGSFIDVVYSAASGSGTTCTGTSSNVYG